MEKILDIMREIEKVQNKILLLIGENTIVQHVRTMVLLKSTQVVIQMFKLLE